MSDAGLGGQARAVAGLRLDRLWHAMPVAEVRAALVRIRAVLRHAGLACDVDAADIVSADKAR